MHAIYDEIGLGYSVQRRTDPTIAKQLFAELAGATRIVNIGAGTGSYEPEHIVLVAVEPSAEMIAQRKPGSHPVEKAFAEQLPFERGSFSHAMTVNSMHHWKDRVRAYREINRVATERFVAITWDPHSDPFWLTRDYFPEIYTVDQAIFPTMREFTHDFDDVQVRPLLIPSDCQDGLLAAYWKRPQAYLSRQIRQSMSAFSKVDSLAGGLQKLESDLSSGAWAENNRAILDLTELDVGYRLVSAKTRHG